MHTHTGFKVEIVAVPSPSIDMNTHMFEGGDGGCTNTIHLHEETILYQWCVLLSILGGGAATISSVLMSMLGGSDTITRRYFIIKNNKSQSMI